MQEKMDRAIFSKNVEKLVNPIDVGSLHFIQQFNKLLPKNIQQKLIESSSKETPYMGFVVEPYATFLFYELKDLEYAKSLLPEGFDLIKTKIFTDDEPKYCCIFGCFTSHTSAFWGTRVEFYIVAEDKSTGLLTWIIADYDSNTISYDKKDGLRSPNATRGVVTIDHSGTVYVDFPKDDGSRNLLFNANIEKGTMKYLDQRLWLEGNLSIGYGSNFDKKDASVFSLKFDPLEVEKALDIPFDAVKIEENSWFPGLFDSNPLKVLCFPYTQHFVSDSPGASSKIKNREELEEAINNIDFRDIKVFSTKSFKTMFLLGSFLSFVVTLVLVILLILKW